MATANAASQPADLDAASLSEGLPPAVSERLAALDEEIAYIHRDLDSVISKSRGLPRDLDTDLRLVDRSSTSQPADLDAASLSEGLPPAVSERLAALDEEIAYIHRDLDSVISKSRGLPRDLDTDLRLVDRSSTSQLLRNRHLPEASRIALAIFLRRYKESEWLQIKDTKYAARASVALAVSSFPLYGLQIAKCGLRGHHCHLPDHCFTCAHWLRVEPAWAQYAGAVERCAKRGWFMYAFTASYEGSADRAGLHLVVHKRSGKPGSRDRLYHEHPFIGSQSATVPPMDLSPDGLNLDRTKACLQTPFNWLSALKRTGLILGAYGNRSLAFAFHPQFWALPHVHGILVTRERLNRDSAAVLFARLQAAYERQPDACAIFPDLHLSELVCQEELDNWLAYILRPLDIAKPYIDAVQEGADLGRLNARVEEIYEGASVVLRDCTSPRSIGCMRLGMEGYLGTGITTATRRKEAKRRREERKKAGLPVAPAGPQGPRRGRIEAELRIAAACTGEDH